MKKSNGPSYRNQFALRPKQEESYRIAPLHPVISVRVGQEKFQPYLESKLEPLALVRSRTDDDVVGIEV